MSSHNLSAKVFAVGLAVAAAGLGSVVQGDEKEKSTDIPVKRVVMFSSGVAFFEHAGQVEGDAEVDLKFNVKDINDLLKSMVLQDQGGGKISTVSYGSKDPITRTLATFSIDLTANPTLADLLKQIRGEQIEIDAPTKIVGIILGVETRKVVQGKDQAVDVNYLNLLTDDGLRSVSLDNVGRIKLTNAKLDEELRKALAVLATGKSQEKKAVSLSFLGAGKRDVKIGYIQEAPIWKTSYRLVLGEEKPPFLQGWAIVENTTETDWNDVNLTLVSGRPISFVMDLYEPLYLARPEVKPELYASLRPRTYDQDMASKDRDFAQAGEREKGKAELADASGDQMMMRLRKSAAAAPPAPPGARGGLGGGFAGRESLKEMKRDSGIDISQGGQSLAQAGNVGEMFRYQIATPVKLERSKSAMLPIVNESVSGEKVSIYNEGTHAKHPLNGLRLKNTTDLHLMQGPMTVFDDGAYAGDAQIQDLQPGTERLISYAMDLDTEVAPSTKSEPQTLTNLQLSKGTMQTTYKYARSRSFIVKNSGKKVKKVLIEHPLETQWTLIAPKEATEKTRDLYRFAVNAEPGKPATLEIKEEQLITQQFAVTNMDDNTILQYINNPTPSEAVKKALAEVIKRKQAIAAVVAKRTELQRQIGVIDVEQKRIRDNMAQLPKESDLFRRYVTKFTAQEDQVEGLRTQVTATIEEEQKLRKGLDEYLVGLDLK